MLVIAIIIIAIEAAADAVRDYELLRRVGIHLVAQVDKRGDRHSAHGLRRAREEAHHELVLEDVLRPVRERGAGSSVALDRHLDALLYRPCATRWMEPRAGTRRSRRDTTIVREHAHTHDPNMGSPPRVESRMRKRRTSSRCGHATERRQYLLRRRECAHRLYGVALVELEEQREALTKYV